MLKKLSTASLFALSALLFAGACNSAETSPPAIPTGPVSISSKDSLFQEERFDSTRRYGPLCLLFEGEPLLSIGQNKSELPEGLHYNLDPNGLYTNLAPQIWDYYSTYYIVEQSKGSLNGVLHFSTDSAGRIFSLTLNWIFDIEEWNESTKQETLETLAKIYPCLDNQLDFENNRRVLIESKDYIEKFGLIPPDEIESSFYTWRLTYVVELK